MSRPLARPHSLRIEDSIWNVLVEHVARRDESASQFTNAVLREALNMVPHEADQYMPGFDGGKGLSIGFKQTVHPGDPYEDIDLGETTAADYTKVPEEGSELSRARVANRYHDPIVPEDGAEF